LDVLSNVPLVNEKPEIKNQSKASLFISKNEFIKTIFEDTVSNVEDEIDEEIYEISKEEADNMLEKIDSLMENISPVFDITQNNELKRYLHTLKGSVRMAGANRVGAVAHRLETILDYSENRKISLNDIIDLLNEELDKINFLMKDPKQSLTKEQMDWLDRKDLEKVANSDVKDETILDTVEDKTNSNANVSVEKLVPVVKKEEKQFIKVNSEVIDSLINEAGEIRLTRTTLEGMADNEKKSLNELKGSTYKLLKMFKEVEIQAESQIQAGKDKHSEDNTFDPLEFDRYTRLQELTRFMNEIVADIQDTVIELDGFNKVQNSTISNQASLTNNVLDSLMKVRLVPFSSMNNRLYKVTRETAKELGKKVTLELHGENTEFDRIVLDKIITPIDHLLRNSISHGIEMPEERISSGKDVAGKIKITTQLEGNFIVISIEDDGAGINVEKIQSIGLKKGLLIPGKDYSKEEIIDLIFHNGFSTADAVSKVAGRGVGMDIVKSDVSALSGSITITTEREKGTKFTIVLPVALATNQAMLSENLGKLVAIPAILVNEVISCKKMILEESYAKGFVTSRGKDYKLVYMGHLIGELNSNQKPEIKNYNSVVLVNYLNEDLAVHVDKLQTTNEILIKKIGTHLSKVNGLLGVTLLGDGRQGIVVNPVMLEKHFENYVKHKKVESIVNKETQHSIDTISVMVVDDSITVRRITSKILEKNNFHVILAKDGKDALEQLQISTPDIILSDIEMPNMDGFELLKNLKNSDKYKNIPVIMITSRTADKHRNYAFELGVNGFLGKPFNEEELLEKINELLKK
jgi:chemosensory pili system protein ChpA (sensor histidine kinase/response regulator)